MANRDDIIKKNINFMYGRSQEMSMLDPDKRSFVPSRKALSSDTINGFEGDYSFLSPSFESFVCLPSDFNPYSTFEHALQASKTTDSIKKQSIREAKHAREAKRLGSKIDAGQAWKDKCIEIAEQLLRDKFQRNKEIRKRLMQTDHKTLRFMNDYGDQFWGVNKEGKGQNQLGKLLEKIRNDIEHGDDIHKWLNDHFKLVSEHFLSIDVVVERNGIKIEEDCQLIEKKSQLFIGKSEGNDILCNHMSVSRRHSVLLADQTKGSLIIDLHTQNGTFVNNHPCTPYIPHPINSDSVVSFGASTRKYKFIINMNAHEKRREKLYEKIANGETAQEDVAELTIFVGNIPFTATVDDLRVIFEGCGTIRSLTVPRAPLADSHKGIAFITFEAMSGVVQALSRDGDELQGRKLNVRRSTANKNKRTENTTKTISKMQSHADIKQQQQQQHTKDTNNQTYSRTESPVAAAGSDIDNSNRTRLIKKENKEYSHSPAPALLQTRRYPDSSCRGRQGQGQGPEVRDSHHHHGRSITAGSSQRNRSNSNSSRSRSNSDRGSSSGREDGRRLKRGRRSESVSRSRSSSLPHRSTRTRSPSRSPSRSSSSGSIAKATRFPLRRRTLSISRSRSRSRSGPRQPDSRSRSPIRRRRIS